MAANLQPPEDERGAEISLHDDLPRRPDPTHCSGILQSELQELMLTTNTSRRELHILQRICIRLSNSPCRESGDASEYNRRPYSQWRALCSGCGECECDSEEGCAESGSVLSASREGVWGWEDDLQRGGLSGQLEKDAKGRGVDYVPVGLLSCL